MTVTSTESTTDYAVGVDVGGTHTDLILAGPVGLTRRKAFTTHGDYSEGILSALSLAAAEAGLSVDEVLRRCGAFVNGSTIVTNVLTEMRGAKTGVLITRGFRDTFRLAGGARTNDYDDHAQAPPLDLVARDCIIEIDERVTSAGEVLVAVDETQVRAAAAQLQANGVEAIAVCYLWSFRENGNERRTGEILAEEFPGLFVTLSSEIHPVIREYERFMTAVFNCLSHRATTRYVEQLKSKLEAHGFAGSLTFFQGIGGSVGPRVVEDEPIKLLASGPAGGVMGARYAAEQLGLRNILVGDMGGTSFDTSVIFDLEPSIAKHVAFGPLRSAVDIVDVVSVGAGGGSIAWIDARGVPQVGPESAGSEPGPACYGRGGVRPTVTDANLVLGLIDPTNYLQGRHTLDVEAARRAIATDIAEPLGWTVERAATAIHELALISMANALRVVSIERGHDPRELTFFAYGGGLGLFAVEIARRLGCPDVVIPDNSSAFSAYGVLIADYVRQYNQTVQWVLSDTSRVDEINRISNAMIENAIRDAREEGIGESELVVRRTADCRFLGQVYEINVPLPDRPLTAEDATSLDGEFPAVYERNYGEGTAWLGTPVVLVNLSIHVTHRRAKPTVPANGSHPSRTPEATAEREVFVPQERRTRTVPIHADGDLHPGDTVTGPCIIDVADTTIFVPDGSSATKDQFFNFRVTT
jgi:N-methylhydantoinase A